MTLVRAVAIPLVCAAGALCVGQVNSGGTLLNGTVLFRQGDSPTDPLSSGPSADMRIGGPGSLDHVFQTWWWYRLEGDTRESAFHNASAWQWNAATATQSFVLGGVPGRAAGGAAPTGLSADLFYALNEIAPHHGQVVETMTLTNMTTVTQQVHLFKYLDFDLGGDKEGDIAELLAPGDMEIRDIARPQWVAQFQAASPAGHEASGWPDLVLQLTDEFVDDLAGTGLPFGPGDFSAAYQWSPVLGPGETVVISTSFELLPEPSAAVLLLGMIPFFRRR